MSPFLKCLQSGIFALVIFSLKLEGVSTSPFGRCDHEQVIKAGSLYYVFSPGYPNQDYRPGSRCRWVAKSDRPINMTCHFRVPTSKKCGIDVVVIKSSKSRGRQYCGTGSFNIVSKLNQLTVKLYSSVESTGGNFLCRLRAVTTISDTGCTCGWEKPRRLVGGSETDVNQYPMMAALMDYEKDLVFCGATIINPKQVLTAAHCVDGISHKILGVIVGEHDTKRDDETDATKVLPASACIVHPKYNPIREDYDIAIVTVEEKIVFDKYIGPACLPFRHSHDSFARDYAEILGWGSTEFGGKASDTLQVIRVHIVSNRKCSKTCPEITKRQICTKEMGKDSCQFDSGGPILWTDPKTKNRVLIAIVSYGTGCATEVPSVNTRVGAFIDWILLQAPSGTCKNDIVA